MCGSLALRRVCTETVATYCDVNLFERQSCVFAQLLLLLSAATERILIDPLNTKRVCVT